MELILNVWIKKLIKKCIIKIKNNKEIKIEKLELDLDWY
jgi:hypothetical protein